MEGHARRNPEPHGHAPQRSVLLRAIPNLLTSTRLAIAIAFPLIPPRWRLAALLTAAATEFFDGLTARLLGTSGTVGRMLDPIADKVFVVSVLATLLVGGPLRPWQLVAIMSRDIVVTGGALWIAMRRGIGATSQMAPSLLGKLATALQFLFLIAVVATREVNVALLIAASVTSAAAAVDYVARFR
jgi:phosphatidylglycerophosphate synthase